jgi:hypothetical protein
MKKLIFSLLCFASLPLFAQDVTVINDPNVEKRELSGSFNSIKVSNGIELLLTQGNDESIAVSASEQKFLERLKTEVDNGVLKIYYDNKGMVWNGNERRKLKAYVSFKKLQSLRGSSGADVSVQGSLTLDKLEMDFSSGAEFTGKVDITEMEVSQSSGSQIDITGKAQNLKADLSSGSMLKGYDLSVDFCNAKTSSGAGVRISVNKELNARASSGGGIRYKGDAVIKDLDVSSGGFVKKS